jgi:hypothetical protein
LRGSAGKEDIRASHGPDPFLFTTVRTADDDTIADHEPIVGSLVLDSEVFTVPAGLAGSGRSAANFASGPGVAAQTASVSVLDDSPNGDLSYDADGGAVGSGLEIAPLLMPQPLARARSALPRDVLGKSIPAGARRVLARLVARTTGTWSIA